MRGCLAILVGGLLFLLVLAWVALPPLSAAVVLAGLTASGLAGTGTTVTVAASPPLALLGIHADALHVGSAAVSWHGLQAAELTLDLGDVDLGSRTFASLTGRLTDVGIVTADGVTRIRAIDLSGSSDRVDAVLQIDPPVVAGMALAAGEHALGETPTAVRITAPDRVTVAAGGRDVVGRLSVDPTGALVAEFPAFGRAVLAEPGPNLPLTFTGVLIRPDGGLTVDASVDVGALGLSG